MFLLLAQLVVSITGPDWHYDGAPRVPVGIRTVNATHLAAEFLPDPNASMQAFVAQLPAWRAAGITAISLNFQGGCRCTAVPPQQGDNQTPDNSPYVGTSIEPAALERMRVAIDAAEDAGIAVFLGLYYFGQDHRVLESDVVGQCHTVAAWIAANGWQHVVIDLVNEVDITDDDGVSWYQPIFRENRVSDLFPIFRGYGLIVGTSLRGCSLPSPALVAASDYINLHGNDCGIAQQLFDIDTLQALYPDKPIIYTEEPDSPFFGVIDDRGVGALLYDDARFQTVPVPTWELPASFVPEFAARNWPKWDIDRSCSIDLVDLGILISAPYNSLEALAELLSTFGDTCG